MESDRSKKLFKRSQISIPGGVNSPVRAFKSVGGAPPFIKKAEGAYIWDVDDNQYIDYVGSWGPMILGHAHPHVINAVKEVLSAGTSYGAPTEKEVILAEMIIDRVPGCEMIRLVNSGTEATMSAVRLARGISGKSKILKFKGCYHGHSDSFLIQAGSGALTLGQPNSPGVTEGTANDTLLAQFNKIQTVIDLFNSYASEIAAIIVEPVNGNAGCILPEKSFLDDLRKICDDFDSLLIFDEVMTGFRISLGGASEYFSVIPDLYTFGKVIGGGFPIGAYGGKKEFMKEISPAGPIYQAGTLSGNPIAVTAGIATLELLNKEAYDKLEQLGLYFQEHIQHLIDNNNYPLVQSRIGSMFSLFFHSGPVRNMNDVAQCDFNAFSDFFHSLLANGVYIAPSQFEVGFISLSHNRDILDKTLSIIDISLQNVMVCA